MITYVNYSTLAQCQSPEGYKFEDPLPKMVINCANYNYRIETSGQTVIEIDRWVSCTWYMLIIARIAQMKRKDRVRAPRIYGYIWITHSSWLQVIWNLRNEKRRIAIDGGVSFKITLASGSIRAASTAVLARKRPKKGKSLYLSAFTHLSLIA